MATSKKATGKKKVQRGKQRAGSTVRDLRPIKDNVVTGGVRRRTTIT